MSETQSAAPVGKAPTADDRNGRSLTRRSILAGGGATVSLAAFVLPTNSAFAVSAADEGWTVEAWGTVVRTFDVHFRRAIDVGLVKGARIIAPGAADPDLRISARFDSRLQQWTGDAASVRTSFGTQLVAVEHEIDAHGGVIRLLLPHKRGNEILVTFPLQDVQVYPNENIASVGQAHVVVTRADGVTEVARSASLGASVTATGIAWAGELAVTWFRETEVEGKHGSGYVWPASIHLRSNGPGDVPAGSRIRIATDGNIVGSMSLRSATTGDGASVNTTVFEPDLRGSGWGGYIDVGPPLAAGESLVIDLNTTTTTTPLVTDAITFARVTLSADRDTQGMQRRSGRESAVAVSSSGVPLMPDGARSRN